VAYEGICIWELLEGGGVNQKFEGYVYAILYRNVHEISSFASFFTISHQGGGAKGGAVAPKMGKFSSRPYMYIEWMNESDLYKSFISSK